MRPTRLLPLLCSAFLLVRLASPAHACTNPLGCPLVIDDFEVGPVDISTSPVTQTWSGLPSQNCFFIDRTILVADEPIHVFTGPIVGPDTILQMDRLQDDEWSTVTLSYRAPAPRDLTAGGHNDRLHIDLYGIAALGTARIRVEDSTIEVPETAFQTTPVTVSFDEFPDVDWTAVTRIYFTFVFTLPDDHLEIRRIRVAGPVPRGLIWDVPALAAIGPPFPLPGPEVLAWRDASGVLVPAEHLLPAVVAAVNLENETDLPLEMTTFTGPAGESSPGPQLGWRWTIPAASGVGTPDARVDFALYPTGPTGEFPAELVIPPAPVLTADGILEVPFEVLFQNGAGDLEFISHRLRLELDAGGPWTLGAASFFPPPSELGGQGLGLRVDLMNDPPGAALRREDAVLARLQLEGDWAPFSESTAAPVVGPATRLRLRAGPSVTDGSTRFTWSRGLATRAELTIVDARGRRVRTLFVPAGATTAAWDGRDDRGAPAGSGAYLARLAADGLEAVARVLVVR